MVVGEEAARATQPKLSKLFQANFFRIILDDAENIMDPNWKISEDFCIFRDERRWTIIATPVPDSYLFSYLLFMEICCFEQRGGTSFSYFKCILPTYFIAGSIDFQMWNYCVNNADGDRLQTALHETILIRLVPIRSEH
jgi:hypothetical protein